MPIRKRLILCSIAAFGVGMSVAAVSTALTRDSFVMVAIDVVALGLNLMVVCFHVSEV